MSQAVIREIDDSRRSQCAIMFTDILGFTSLMHQDEQRTIQKMESHRNQLEILHEKYGGEIIQYYGDGSLSVFNHAIDAIHCAMAIQQNVVRLNLPLKIGIHKGDIVRKGSAVYGDGINVASRIESIGVAHSILFSEAIWEDIRHEGLETQSLGSLHFKNVDKPIKVRALVMDGLTVPDKNALEGKLENRQGRQYRAILMGTVLVFLLAIAGMWRYNMYLNSLLDDDITTMGVMPFRFEGVKSLDASFQSGLLENLVTYLSSFHGMQVLSSHSTEGYANSTEKPTEIGEELSVSHLLYGTLRQGPDDSIRINMELVDVRNGRNIWAKSYNRKPEDLFSDPVDISSDLADFLEARENPYRLEGATESTRMSPTTFRLIAEAREEAERHTAESFALSNDLLNLAIAKDSSLALGYALLSQNYSQMHAYGFLETQEAQDLAEQNGGIALYMDRNMAEGYASNALMQYTFYEAEPQEILDLLQEAVLLRPSYDYAYHLMGQVHYDLGEFEMAKNYFQLALKLNPDNFSNLRMMAKTTLALGDRRLANKLFGKLAGKYPELTDTKLALVDYYFSKRDFDRVEKVMEDIMDPLRKEQIRLRLAVEQDDLTLAGELAKRITTEYPNRDPGLPLLLYYDKAGNTQKSWEILDRALANKATWLKELKNVDLRIKEADPDRFSELLEDVGLVHEPA
ncbi:MAG: tetratricopeptide repeat protein [Saprospiraceae bacterium]|nr:tetratricopeptide repeat protein [Saprospiraceae bacterium]